MTGQSLLHAPLDKFAAVVANLADQRRTELLMLSEEELRASFQFAWNPACVVSENLYHFTEAIERFKRDCREWETHHHGSAQVAQRVRDKYLLPVLKAFEAKWLQPALQGRHPTLAECEMAGAGYDKGGSEKTPRFLPDTPEERQRFEAYMHGHCWAVGSYSTDQQGYDDMLVRMLYGVWRDRGALPTTPYMPKGH